MKRSLFLSVLIIISFSVFSQDLTGIWRGNFYAGVSPFQESYKYEVQIDQLKNNSLQGVTYSYLTTVFYGKATFTGIWFPKSQSALVKELKLIELKTQDNTDACAMTCNLDYSKQSGKEILRGTFTSVNSNSKTDCGGGTVYLERVQESDFHKEDFLLKKKPAAVPSTQNNSTPKVTAPVVNDVSKINAKKLQTALGVTPDGAVGPKTLAALKKKLPGFNDKVDVSNSNQVNDIINRIKKANAIAAKKIQPAAKPSTPNKIQPPVVIKKDTITKTAPSIPPAQEELNNLPQKKILPVPDVIKTRSNPLIKTITTNSTDIKVELYDNGDIDGDTITVYDNNQVIAWKKGLTDKPITLNIKADATTPVHEFVMVADNLGTIPPNTALMVITTGGKRYQVFISSDNQKNAKVIVQYNP
ncbi:MAG: hypothetical protein ABJB05_03670 [Parafilimonas sp.]